MTCGRKELVHFTAVVVAPGGPMGSRPKFRMGTFLIAGFFSFILPSASNAQSTAGPMAATPVPRMIWFSGSFRPADGLTLAPMESVTFAIYVDQQGGSPLWQETQNVSVNADGRYHVLLGSASSEGLPIELFATGEPRWLGVRFNRSRESEQPRVQLVSVPY